MQYVTILHDDAFMNKKIANELIVSRLLIDEYKLGWYIINGYNLFSERINYTPYL